MNEAEVLLTHLLGCTNMALYTNRHSVITQDISLRMSAILKKRRKGMPLAYILGVEDFMGLCLCVKEGVFIPRPETEIVVETVLNLAEGMKKPQGACLHILDMGTGSGCIAIALAKSLPAAQITAVDISNESLGVACENAFRHKVNIKFLQGDLFSNRDLYKKRYDFIVSNPPYIPSDEILNLPAEVRFEPSVAIDGGEDGLYYYRRIIQDSPRFLREGGYLVMELGINQQEPVADLLRHSGAFIVEEILKDYLQIERVVVAKRV